MLKRPPDEARLYLEAAIRRQRDVLLRKGVSDDLVESDMRALETAIGAALWRAVLMPGGDAA